MEIHLQFILTTFFHHNIKRRKLVSNKNLTMEEKMYKSD